MCCLKCALISATAAGACEWQTAAQPVWSEGEVFGDFSIKSTLLGFAPLVLPEPLAKDAAELAMDTIPPVPPSFHWKQKTRDGRDLLGWSPALCHSQML